jgi:pyruvate ferredoxin oxidoreductase gamma subunit
VVVLDPTLLRVIDVASGLKEKGALIVNTKKPDEVKTKFGTKWKLATLDATGIAWEILGVPITNTTMIGALVKATEVVKLQSLFLPLEHRFEQFAQRNIKAMKKAYEQTLIFEPNSS